MTQSTITPPHLEDLSRIALFLDFDGTLAEFVNNPADVSVPQPFVARLIALSEATTGALAIVTGREVHEIDRFLDPLKAPVAGVHGLVRRTSDGRVIEGRVDRDALAEISARVEALAARLPGVLIEQKSCAVALHYRQVPEAGAECDAVMEAAVAAQPGFKVQRGKAVIEARIEGHDKGSAIKAFLGEQPFEGRLPVFAGDDVTDEDGFAAVSRFGGISVKVGDGASLAQYRVANVAALHRWLEELG